MIWFKGKPWKKTLDSLIASQNFVNLSNEDLCAIEKRLRKGFDVYITFNPYASEIEECNELMWDIDPETLNQRFLALKEEI